MLRTLWYLVKICLVLGVATYLASLPGDLVVEWGSYRLSVQMGFVAAAAFLGFLVLMYVSGLAYRIVSFPRAYMRSREEKRRAIGYQSLLRSLTAASLGDQKNARYLAYRAQKYLPEAESGLPLLLQAQAMHHLAEDKSKDEPYQLLLKNTETALLGIQGLVQNAVKDGDYPKALSLAREARTRYPKNYALLRPIYDLEIRNQLWNDALVTLDKAVKKKIISSDVADHDRVAIYMVLGGMAMEGGRSDEAITLYKKALHIDPSFVPAGLRLARVYMEEDQRKQALSVVSKLWKQSAHPDLVPLWMDLMPEAKAGEVAPHRKWFLSVAQAHPDALPSVLGMAQAAIEDGLWGDARAALAKAEKLGPTAELYRLWVKLEEKTDNRPDIIRQWMDRANHAPQGSGWVCSRTGRVYSEWQAIVEPDSLFNTLVWQDKIGGDPQLVLSAA